MFMSFQLIVVGGPTASGKSALAVKLAQYWQTEIVSVDSVQFFRQLNIGSAKITPQEQQGIYHYGLNFLDYHQKYSIKNFQEDILPIIKRYQLANKPLILCGGSALYLHAILYNYQFFEENKDHDLPYLESLSLEELCRLLMLCDYQSYLKVDIHNRQRLTRSLIRVLYQHPSNPHSPTRKKDNPFFPYRMILLNTSKEELRIRITQRVYSMFEEGLLEEVQELFRQDPQLFTHSPLRSVGYGEFCEYFEGKIDLDIVRERIIANTLVVAKKQLTFFRNKFHFREFDSSCLNFSEIINFLKK